MPETAWIQNSILVSCFKLSKVFNCKYFLPESNPFYEEAGYEVCRKYLTLK